MKRIMILYYKYKIKTLNRYLYELYIESINPRITNNKKGRLYNKKIIYRSMIKELRYKIEDLER